jgi:thiol-disulfide isomerase/thioredoxin
MRTIGVAVLYTAVMAVANMGAAEVADLREGDMRKLNFHSEPVAAGVEPFEAADGGQMTLADFQGRHVVLNFWATWCAPCREEMPTLSALQAAMGGDAFAVVTIATGRNDPVGMQQFFEEIGVDNLPLHRDPQQRLAREMGVLGLPITVILDPEGMEIARLQGDADWSSESAMAIVAALVAGE